MQRVRGKKINLRGEAEGRGGEREERRKGGRRSWREEEAKWEGNEMMPSGEEVQRWVRVSEGARDGKRQANAEMEEGTDRGSRKSGSRDGGARRTGEEGVCRNGPSSAYLRRVQRSAVNLNAILKGGWRGRASRKGGQERNRVGREESREGGRRGKDM